MTKIGEGKFHPPEPQKPEQDLKACAEKFRKYLGDYKLADTPTDKKLAQERMKSELSLMDLAAENAKKKTRVQEQKVAKDFKFFEVNPSPTNLEALEHDLNTLKESLD